MTVWLIWNSVYTQFHENQPCDSESKMGTHDMVILLILFVFILRKESGQKMLHDKNHLRNMFLIQQFSIPEYGKNVLICSFVLCSCINEMYIN
jgi:hypothetical protein